MKNGKNTVWEVRFYKTRRGEAVVESFMWSQDKAAIAKFSRFLDLLERRGPDIGMPYSRYLGSRLYELRIRGKNEIRIFYVSFSGTTIVLLHAFNKRSQKIPDKELGIARSRQKELTII